MVLCVRQWLNGNRKHQVYGKGLQKWPSVSRILSRTRSEKDVLILLMWKKKMISKMGVEAFDAMQKETLATGSSCHSAIEHALSGTPLNAVQVPNNCHNLWSSVLPVLTEVRDVREIEQKVWHSALGYYGICDCVAEFRGTLCLIEWKTSKKPKDSLDSCHDYPLQVAAYAGAYNSTRSKDDQVSNGLVVVMYHDGSPSSAHLMNTLTLEYYWREWLQRLWTYKTAVDDNSGSTQTFPPDWWLR